MATGEIEIQAEELEILSRSTPLPFQLDEEGVDETIRAPLPLARPAPRRHAAEHPHAREARLGSSARRWRRRASSTSRRRSWRKPTPEGARDFLVPTRLQPGRFFALPQSPQIYKQLLVISGFERYYQIARCFRDEDLRADRLQEITQLDVEMAFPDQEFLFGADRADHGPRSGASCRGVELPTPFQRMTWDEADRRYGSDKPDLRFGLEIEEATDVTRGSEFKVFADAPCVRFIRIPRELSRGDLAKLEEVAKGWGAKGLAYLVYAERRRGALADREVPRRGRAGAVPARPPDRPSSSARPSPPMVSRVLGALRLHLGRELELIDGEA